MRSSSPLLARLLLGLCLGWAAISLVRETAYAVGGWRHRRNNDLPCGWRLGMGPVDRLRHCLAGIDGMVPPDSVIAFASPPAPCGAEFFRWRWAAYMLPDQHIVTTLEDFDGRQLASYLITYRRLAEPPPDASLELIRQLDGGRLYRIIRR